jgi:hypothetical protein
MTHVTCEAPAAQSLLNALGALAVKPSIIFYATDTSGLNVTDFLLWYAPSGNTADTLHVTPGLGGGPIPIATGTGWLTTAGLSAVTTIKIEAIL